MSTCAITHALSSNSVSFSNTNVCVSSECDAQNGITAGSQSTHSSASSTSLSSSSSSSSCSSPSSHVYSSSSSIPSLDDVLRSVKKLYSSYGNSDYIGEDISQVEHGLQCAYFANAAKAPPAVIIASLFHDIGQLVGLDRHLPEMPGNVGICHHETVGADYLRSMNFPELTCQLVARHVDAKRYFTATNTAYYNKLSAASKLTLIEQGGPMSASEVQRFEEDPLKKWILLMRTWDDKAKIEDFKVPTFDEYVPMIQMLLEEEKKRKANEQDTAKN